MTGTSDYFPDTVASKKRIFRTSQSQYAFLRNSLETKP